MPRPRHHRGSGRLPVIPHDWETAHAPVAAKTQTAKCRIAAPTSRPVISDDLSYDTTPDGPTPPAPLYDGGCRIQKITVGDGMTVTGEQAQARTRYLLVIDRAASGITVGSVVDVYDSNDPDLNAGTLTVAQTTGGTLRFERDLICVTSEGV